MSVTLDSTWTWVGPDRRRVRWASDLEEPTYWVYLNGEFVGQTRVNHLVIGADDVLEVFDAAPAAAEIAAGEARATLGWTKVGGTARYRVEQYVGAEWLERGRVPDKGQMHQEWRTPELTEGEDHSFRVTPLGTNGNAGTPATVAVNIARHPAVPVVDWAYGSGTGKVTITQG